MVIRVLGVLVEIELIRFVFFRIFGNRECVKCESFRRGYGFFLDIFDFVDFFMEYFIRFCF